MVDGLGTDLALSGGRRPASGAGRVPAVSAAWHHAFSAAGYVLLTPKSRAADSVEPRAARLLPQPFPAGAARYDYTYNLYARDGIRALGSAAGHGRAERDRQSFRCRTRPAWVRYRCMVKTRNLPDDPGDDRTMTGAEGEVTTQPASSAAGPAGEPPAERPAAAVAADTAAESPRERAKLLFASFMMLFVELALIRWVTANNVYVTKATNFVLLASFLGIGIGFLNARTRRDYLRWTPVALLLLVSFVLAFPVILQTLNGPHPFQGLQRRRRRCRSRSASAWSSCWWSAVMAGLGQGTARLFVGFRPLRAYRFDILGSLAGIAAFTGAVLPRPAARHLGRHRLRRAARPARPHDPLVAVPRRRRPWRPCCCWSRSCRRRSGRPTTSCRTTRRTARPARCTCPRTTSPTRRPVRWP